MINSTAVTGRQNSLAWDSRRLWSLWEMMRFSAEKFVRLADNLGQLRASLTSTGEMRNARVRGMDRKALATWLSDLLVLNLRVTHKHAQHIIDELQKPISEKDFAGLLSEFQNRMRDELALCHFFYVTDQERAFFSPTAPLFGKEVEDKLSLVIEDISEAGKCIGLGRSTAAVFHLMRVMETGVQKLGDKLGVLFTDEKVWQIILDQVNAAIKKLDQKANETKKYAAISAYLYNVKLAWRNEAMHPKATYTPEEAEAIFLAVRAYMKELASVL